MPDDVNIISGMGSGLMPMPMSQTSTGFIGGGIATKQSSELIKWELDTGDVQHQIKQDFLGTQFDIKSRSYQKVIEPLMSQEAVHRLFAFTKFDFSKNTVLSTFTEEQINAQVWEYESISSFMLHMKADEWGIEGQYLMPIRSMLGRSVLASYNRALQGNTMKSLQETQSHSEIVTNQGQQKKSFIGTLLKGGVS